mmetsp:Transcript_35590/g.57582  ORF Transcript_35590/g.57582 Transcript_35590/m.57582 type:complete len:308 (-) Transcript_35590:1696-2619(-)
MNVSLYSHSLSASAILRLLPLFCMAFSSTGSRTGSISSSMFSISRGLPKAIQSSRCIRKFLSCSCVTRSMFFSSLFLIHATPCPWGSIRIGHRDDLVTMIPFCMESSSVGRPCKFHSPTVASSTINLETCSPWVTGMLRVCRSVRNFFASRSSRNSWLKGPAYETKEHASATSPTRRVMTAANSLRCAVQRIFSEAKPLIRALAISMRLLVFSASSCSRCFSAVAASKLCRICSSSDSHASRSFCAADSLELATRSLASAILRDSSLGPTIFLQRVYSTMARTHAHRPATAPALFLAASKLKSSISR